MEAEKKSHEAEVRERDALEKKAQERAREDFNYAFKREQQAIKDKLTDEKLALEKEIKVRRETAEKDLAEREKVIGEKERELAELRAKATAFSKELENAVNHAVKETGDRLKLEAKNREDLLVKQFEGERNVLLARNEGLEKANKDLVAANANSLSSSRPLTRKYRTSPRRPSRAHPRPSRWRTFRSCFSSKPGRAM